MPETQPFDRSSVDQLVARLRDLEGRVPSEARRFRKSVNDLIQQSEKARRQFLPWVRKREIQERVAEVVRLERAAPYVAELFSQADGARRKIQNLRLRLGKSRIASEVSWIEARCVRWEAALNSLGATLPRASAVARARGIVAETVARVDLHDDAVEWLERGHQVLRDLEEHGLEVEGAALAADLPAFAAAFRADGPSRKAVDELAGDVQDLDDLLARQPREAPVEYTDAAGNLDRVEEWHHALKALGQLDEQEDRALIDLRERLEVARRAWRRQDPEDANAVLGEARELLARTVETARQRRTKAFQELRQQVRYLGQISGPTEAEEELESLEESNEQEPRDHRRWWSDLDRIRDGFWAEAENELEELAARMTERKRALEARVGLLSEIPLSEQGRSRLDRLESALRELARSSEPKDALRDLQVLDRLSEDAETLRSDVAAASEDLVARRAAAEQRKERLRREGERAGIPVEDLLLPAAEPEEQTAVASLEEAEVCVSGLEEEVGRAEQGFVEACSEVLQQVSVAYERVIRALETVGSRSGAADAPFRLEPDATVTQASDAVVDAWQRQAEIEAEADAAWADLNQRCEVLLARLDELSLDSLRPGDRDEVTALAEDLRSRPWDEVAVPADRLELLAAAVGRADDFFARLSREENEARERLAALRDRFEALRTEELHDACSELYDRVEALVRGVPEEPVRWFPVLQQIAQAEDLLTRLEIHGRRLAVSQVGEAVDMLERQNRRGLDPEAERLLGELAALDPHELPPPALRRRLERLARAAEASAGRRNHG